jgi:PAS domain S-box-containing protein
MDKEAKLNQPGTGQEGRALAHPRLPDAFWQQHSPAFLEKVLNLSLRCVCILDEDGVVRSINSGCYSIFGTGPQAIVGRHFQSFYPDAHDLARRFAELQAGGRVDRWPGTIMRIDRQTKSVELALMRVEDTADRLLGSVVIIQDLHQPQDLLRQWHQQQQELVQLNRSLELANLELERVHRQKSDFLANTSHELRTPLNAIIGFLRLVLDGLCDSAGEERSFLQNAYDSARGLVSQINDLLDGARLEAGKIDLHLQEVQVGAVFPQVEKLIRPQADQHKVRLSFRPPRGRILVRADPMKLQQILLNLLTNAIKFAPKGEVRVQARAFPSKGHVRFQVRDTGTGMPPASQGFLLPKVVQGAWTNPLPPGGAGMGLAICQNLVECMGGQIWLSSPGPGQGTMACFTLPLVTLPMIHWRRLEDRERGFELKGPATGPVVLLVEDDPRVLDVLGRLLQKSGYRTAFAVTADDGLEGAQRLAPDLITIDLGLPVRPQGRLHTGLDLYRALQQTPHLKDLPVILITGHDAALTQPPQDLPPSLLKPFRAQALIDLVARRLAGT